MQRACSTTFSALSSAARGERPSMRLSFFLTFWATASRHACVEGLKNASSAATISVKRHRSFFRLNSSPFWSCSGCSTSPKRKIHQEVYCLLSCFPRMSSGDIAKPSPNPNQKEPDTRIPTQAHHRMSEQLSYRLATRRVPLTR